MKLYLVSNNLLLDGLKYNDIDLDLVRITRPLSYKGEVNAKKISEIKELENVEKIYSSIYSSTLSTAKYLGNKLDLDIYMSPLFNDCKVGILGSKNMKMVKGLQEHDFDYKLSRGESLNEVGKRLDNEIKKLIEMNENAVIFTHKRAILGFLLKYTKVGFNLDDNLILEYDDKLIYDDTESEYDIYKIEIFDNEIKKIDLL